MESTDDGESSTNQTSGPDDVGFVELPATSDTAPEQAEDVDSKVSALQNHIEDLLDRNNQANKEIDALQEIVKSRGAELSQAKQREIEAVQQQNQLQQQLASQNAEIGQLCAEKMELRRQLTETLSTRNAAILQLDDIKAREEALANSQRLHAQEVEILHSQKRNLEEQMIKLEAELSTIQTGSREAHLMAQVQNLTHELRTCDEASLGMRTLLVQEQARVQVLAERLENAHNSESTLKEVHAQEVQAQIRVALLCQEESKEARSVAEKMSASLSELQTALNEAVEKYKNLEGSVNSDKAELMAQLERKDEVIKNLKEELVTLNSDLEKIKQDTMESFVEQLFPGAVAVGRQLPADMTLSKLFMKYVNASKELDGFKDEKDQHQLKLGFLSTELKERESELSVTKVALEEVQKENQQLHLDKRFLTDQREEAESVAQEAMRMANQHAKDKVILAAQVQDLSAQVSRIVTDIESVRQGLPLPPLPEISQDEPTTKRLLLFRNVAEMQHCNVELLAALRSMQDRAEQAERLLSETQDMKDVISQLEEAKEEIRRMQNSNVSQEHLIQILSKQREHFEKLAKRPLMQEASTVTEPISVPSPGKPFVTRAPIQVPANVGGSPPIFMKLRKTEEALSQVTKDFELFRNDSHAQFNMVTEQLETMRLQLSESKLSEARMRADCDTAKERNTIARATIDALSNQIEGLRTMRQSHENTITRQEKCLLESHKELIKTHSKLTESEGLLARAQAEIRKLQISEGALRNSCEVLRKNTFTQQMVLQSAQELKACRMTAEAEQRLVLMQKLEISEQENKEIKQKLQEEITRLSSELCEVQGALETEKMKVAASETVTKQAQDDLARAMERLAQSKRDVLALRAHRNPVVEAEMQTDLLGHNEQAAVERMEALQVELSAKQETLTSLQQQLQQQRQATAISEQKIVKLQEAHGRNQQEANKRLEMARSECSQLKSRISSLQSELSATRTQVQRTEEQLTSCKAQLACSQAALQRQQKQVETRKPGDEAIELHRELEAAKAKIQCCEVQHKRDLHAISTFRKQALQATTAVEELKCKLAETSAADNQGSAKQSESVDDAEIGQLREQNAALLDQIQAMGAELCALKSTSETVNTSLNTSSSFSEEDAQKPEQLLNVLRHLRREKEVALSRAESLQHKVQGLKVELEAAERQIKESRESFAKAAQSSSDSLINQVKLTAEQYREMTERLEALDALTDSNILQREKCAMLENELKASKEENTKMEEIVRAKLKVLMDKEYELRLKTGKEEVSRVEERIKTLQNELIAVRREAVRWRSQATQLTERATKANSEELKKTQFERDNLQRQLTGEREELTKLRSYISTEKENLQKQLNIEREETRKLKVAATAYQSERQNLQRQLGLERQELLKLKSATAGHTSERDNLNRQLANEREELRKLRFSVAANAQERDNLQKQLTSEREELQKLRTSTTTSTQQENEVQTLRGELTQFQEQLTKLQSEHNTVNSSLIAKNEEFEKLLFKEKQVRSIAKRYKTQFESLLASNKTDNEAGSETAAGTSGQAQPPVNQIQTLQKRLTEIQTRANAAESKAAQLQKQFAQTQQKLIQTQQLLNQSQQKLAHSQQQLAQSQQKLTQSQQQLNQSQQKLAQSQQQLTQSQQQLTQYENRDIEQQSASQGNQQSEDRFERMKSILMQARQKLAASDQAKDQAERELAACQQARGECESRISALQSEMQSTIRRLEQEVERLIQENARLSAEQRSQPTSQQQNRPTMRQTQQTQLTGAEKSNVEPPTANIRPMAGPSQAKPSQVHQSATIPPTSRSTPLARLRPMSVASRSVAVLTPSQQQQGPPPTSSSSGMSVVQGMQVASSGVGQSREEVADSQEEAPGATVVLVRPQEVSSSQNLQQTLPPPTPTQSTAPPTLKRTREEGARTEEPHMKQSRGESSSSEVVPSDREEPSSSLHCPVEDILIIMSDDETLEDMESGDGNTESAEQSQQHRDSENQNIADVREEVEGNEAQMEPTSSVQSQLSRVVEVLRDSTASVPSHHAEPSSSSPRPPALRPAQAQLVLPQQQGYEEIGDDGIVPSTPTLFVPRRREGFGEGVSSPQVPQSQGRLFTFASESNARSISTQQVSTAGHSESLDESRSEATDDPETGRSVPSTPLLSSPQETLPTVAPSVEAPVQEAPEVSVTLSTTDETEVASSSSTVPAILITPAVSDSQEELPHTPPQCETPSSQSGETSGSGDDFGSSSSPAQGISVQRGSPGIRRFSRAINRPNITRSPIVWSGSPPQNNQQGMSRGAGMRGRFNPRAMRRGVGGRGHFDQTAPAGLPPHRGLQTRRPGANRLAPRRPF